MENIKTIYYKDGMCGGTKKDWDVFYNLLDKIKNQAINKSHRFSGDYSIFTYCFKNMTVEYQEDDNYGIPYSISYNK